MCLSPLHLVNPSKWIDPNSCQSLFVDVPCGHCSDCLRSYQNEWRNRAYYECLDAFNNDKYVLFDTLTYRPSSLPHLSDFISLPQISIGCKDDLCKVSQYVPNYVDSSELDFPCFSHFDVQLFLANLRSRLKRLGFDSSGIRHFTVCEYGSDIRRTRRPHYHVLFFVPSSIPFDVMSLSISLSWRHGRTDGIPYRSRSYVLNRNVFKNSPVSIRRVCGYVTKYCTKQFSYNSLVRSRLEKLKVLDYSSYSLAKSLVKCGHWQSLGFGNDALIKIVGRDVLLKTGQFKIILSNGLFKYVNLHKSLQRKLLYDYYINDLGDVVWRLNRDGFSYKKRFKDRSVNFLHHLSSVVDPSLSFLCYEQALSKLFVNGRFNESDPDDVIDRSYNIDCGLRNYASVDRSFMHKSVFTKVDFGSKKHGFVSSGDVVDFYPLHYLKNCLINKDVSLIDDALVRKSLNGDSGLRVMKKLNRLKNLFKTTLLC